MGWNCFQVQLAYDPEDNTNQIFTINSNILNTTNVNLFGEEQSYSNGAILSHGSSNPLSSLSQNITSFVGKEAENIARIAKDNGIEHVYTFDNNKDATEKLKKIIWLV